MVPNGGDSDSAAADDNLRASASSIIAALGRGTSHSDDSIGNACSHGLSVALSYDGADAPILDESLYPAVASALDRLQSSLRKFGNGDRTDATRSMTLAKAAGVALAASTAGAGYAGGSATGGAISLGRVRLQCVDALFALLGSAAFRKDPEISLAVGEAVAAYADAFSPVGAVWTVQGTKSKPGSFDKEYSDGLPPHSHAVYILLERELTATSPHKRNACAPAMLAVVGRAAKMVNSNQAYQSRAFIQELLFSLDKFQNAFLSLLSDSKVKQLGRESAVLGLAACRGLILATEPGDGDTGNRARELNERLLRAFGQTQCFGGSAMMETRRQNAERLDDEGRDGSGSIMEEFGESTEVGGASGVGEAALGAYKEMAAAAISLGRPDVLYSLMLLSVTHPVWVSPGVRDRYSATSLLGQHGAEGVNTLEMKQALRPHLQSLIPRLLRACNDPNKQTREQMQGLWISLTGGGAEARSLVTEHFHFVLDALIDDATNKLWRARVGACGALAEAIVGRTWAELGGGKAVMDDSAAMQDDGIKPCAGVRLLRLWRVTTRALDDVRLTVRESGAALARSVRSLTIRLCDPLAVEGKSEGESTAEISEEEAELTAAAAAATALRYLTKSGLNQPCAEAVGVCVSSLLGIVDVARATTLQPVLPELIETLAMSMSGLEPAALNYLQLRAAAADNSGGTGYDELERMRLQIAQGGPIASALNKCLGMVKEIDIEAQKKVIPYIDSALRCGAGFATRAAAADAVASLCSTCPLAFKFPGHSNSNPTVRLLRALYFASERERGSAARDKMAHALGSLAALSPGRSVRALAVRACERYKNAMGSNDDPSARRAAAAALRAIAVRASAQFADGNVWCQEVLPLAYLGQKDDDRKVASLWKDVWEEGGTVASVGSKVSNNSGVLLEERLLPYLVNECVSSLNDVSWARRERACDALIELAEMDVLSPTPRSVSGKSSIVPNCDVLSRSRRRAQAANHALTNCTRLLVKGRVWTGKTQLVKATVVLAGKWVNLGTAEGRENHLYWGWEEESRSATNSSCPWIPIILDLVWDDLFEGDGWFKKDHEEAEESAELAREGGGKTVEPDENEVDEDTALDFSDGDDVPDEHVQPTCSDQEASLPCRSLTLSGLCRALLDQAFPSSATLALWGRDDILPFRSASLQSLSLLCKGVKTSGAPMEQYLYQMLAPKLLAAIQQKDSVPKSEEPPLIIARSIECLTAVMWDDIGESKESTKLEDIVYLSKLFCHTSGHSAWTVREASALACASLASKAALIKLRKHETISTLLECSTQVAKDRKFWRVRCAGLRLLSALVSRVGFSREQSFTASMSATTQKIDPDRQLFLEAILPHKEKILKLAKSGLTDNEPKVTAVATDIIGAVSWWP